MKKTTNTILSLFFLLFSLPAIGQYEGDALHSWNFSYARTGTPGDQLNAGLEYAFQAQSSAYVQLGYEMSGVKGLRYRSVSLAASYRHYIIGGTDMSSPSRINVAIGVGAVAQYETEPSLYRGLKFPERLNFGGQAHILGEYFFDPTVGFYLGFEQRVLTKELLGKYNYSLSFGVRIHFGNQ